LLDIFEEIVVVWLESGSLLRNSLVIMRRNSRTLEEQDIEERT